MNIGEKTDLKKYGFTLAEVLITLGVIGVVAALTIPILMQNTNEKATVSALKKAYSTLSQAYNLAVQDYSTPDMWDLGGVNNYGTSAGAIEIISKLSPYLNMTKNCGTASSCLPSKYTFLSNATVNPDSATAYSKGMISDGTLLYIYSHGSCSGGGTITNRGTTAALQNTCASMVYDINGFKAPNLIGKDAFLFYLTPYGIIPSGTPQETKYSFNNDCITKATGYGCTAWVIYNENMDYFNCSGLSWNGPTTCN